MSESETTKGGERDGKVSFFPYIRNLFSYLRTGENPQTEAGDKN